MLLLTVCGSSQLLCVHMYRMIESLIGRYYYWCLRSLSHHQTIKFITLPSFNSYAVDYYSCVWCYIAVGWYNSVDLCVILFLLLLPLKVTTPC